MQKFGILTHQILPSARYVLSAIGCAILRSRSYSQLSSQLKICCYKQKEKQPLIKKCQQILPVTAGTKRLVSTVGGSIETSTSLANFWQMLSNSTPVAYVQQGIIFIHDITGLPWWTTIIVSTFIFRSFVTLPLAIYQNKITARIENITLEMPALVAELKREAVIAMKKYNWSEKKTRLVYNRSLKKQWNKLIVRDNCHPAKTLIVLWGQIPLWIFQSVALRNLINILPDPNSLEAKLIFTELSIGGFGWIPNLTEVDSSFILPVTLGVINLGIIEMQSMLRTRPPTRLQKLATNTFRVLSLVMVPVASSVPSALCVYWVASSSYGLAQNLLLLSPTVRRAVGVPKTSSEFLHPYKHLWTNIKIRTGRTAGRSVENQINTNVSQTKNDSATVEAKSNREV